MVEGFALAKGEVLAVMDADLQHAPDLLVPLYNMIECGADIALLGRCVDGGESEKPSLPHMLASKCARFAAHILLKSMRTVSDPTSGCFMMRKSVIDSVRLNPIGRTILMEVLVLGNYQTVTEIPCHFATRQAGPTAGFKATVQHILHILSLVTRSEHDRRFFLFVMVGLSGTLIDMVLFWLITSHINNISINLAATISASVGLVNNFLLNRNFTWRNRKSESIFSQFRNYAIANGLGIGIKNIGVYIFVRAGFSGLPSNFFGIMGSTVWNFFMNDRIVFRQKKNKSTKP